MRSYRKVLLIGNDKTNLMILRQILDSMFDVTIAYYSSDAMSLLRSDMFDLIIIDADCKHADVLELYKEIRDNPFYQNTPIIFMVSVEDPEFECKSYRLGVTEVINKNSQMYSINHKIEKVLQLYDYQTHYRNFEKDANRRIEYIQQHIIQSFSSIIEGRDTSTGMHIKRTASYVDIVIKGLCDRGYYTDQLNNEVIDAIVKSAPLHDIGKITVSDTILCKPGKLTEEEFEIMKTHALVGGKLIKETLEDIEDGLMLNTAINMATYHHEKWNGNGYPYKLSGEKIPLAARIMAIADVFDALVSKRCYKESFTYDESFKIIEEETGSHFDPKIGEVFLSLKDDIILASDSWDLK